MSPFYVLLAVAAGVALSVQIGVNNTLRGAVGSPVLSALASFIVGSLCLLVYAVVTRAPWPSAQQLGTVPAWGWLGGALGAYYIASSIAAAPRLGAAGLVSIVVTTQLLASLALDHFGAIGFARHALNVPRVLGALLLIGGVALIVRN